MKKEYSRKHDKHACEIGSIRKETGSAAAFLLALSMVFSGSMILSSCSKKETTSSATTSTITTEPSENVTTSSESTSTDTSSVETTSSEESKETTTIPRDGDSYYSQIENGIVTEIYDQGKDGNCWAITAHTSMATNLLIRTGETLGITVEEVTDATQSDEKTEGLRVRDSGTAKEIGALPIYACWALANGCNGYTLTECPVLFECSDEGGAMGTPVANLVSDFEIKALIRDKGAVIVMLHAGKGEVEGEDYYTVYDGTFAGDKKKYGREMTSEYFTHAAVIIGWDDNFPKENFANGNSGKKQNIPSEDGAWLLQNSGGTDWGDGGYAWVSYESALLFQGVMVVTDKYSEVLSYDVGAPCGIRTGEETIVANVFHHEGTLSAVGTYVGIGAETFTRRGFWGKEDTRITIEIRDAAMQEVLASKDFEADYDGYYVVELDTPLEVTDFAVVVKYQGLAPVEAEEPVGRKKHEVDSFSSRGDREYITNIEEGQSFVYLDGQWLDLSDPETQEALGIEYAPHNCCIKALFEG